ncbi:GUN4 domain-containing protein [Okeania sp.]|uniref:GUN4 domain-containing protein n=1 Tax=Okeania sp. TaxID=3100323 RepID=UPI002B4ACBA6|nr:GUN4 domain-containing protein [Okeania sp.]MEB3341248.1 GUN4 domain-containing protein [Okeania sp.]
MLCPICGAEYMEIVPESCSICDWNLKSEAAFLATAEIYQQKEQAKLNWARKMWQMLQAKENPNHHNNSGLSTASVNGVNDNQNYKDLKKQLEQIQAQLHQATIERFQLHCQLEWVLYHLEQLNPESLAETLYNINEKLDAMPTPEPPMSEVGIDYYPLINLLAAGKWRKADELTWELLLQVALRAEEGWLHLAEIENFPCTDICTIDSLWEYYSHGLFGLNVQQRIWESVSGEYGKFCDRIGWRDGESWKYYDELSFSLEAPEGHLPIIVWRQRACYGVGQMMAAETFLALRSRLATCSGEQ